MSRWTTVLDSGPTGYFLTLCWLISQGGTSLCFVHWEGHPGEHFIVFCLRERHSRGHFFLNNIRAQLGINVIKYLGWQLSLALSWVQGLYNISRARSESEDLVSNLYLYQWLNANLDNLYQTYLIVFAPCVLAYKNLISLVLLSYYNYSNKLFWLASWCTFL